MLAALDHEGSAAQGPAQTLRRIFMKVGAGDTADTFAPGPATWVIDRTFISDGRRWIIDYKTAWLGDDADLARLAQHAERYRSQLETYAALFAEEGLPVKCAIFYVAHGALVNL